MSCIFRLPEAISDKSLDSKKELRHIEQTTIPVGLTPKLYRQTIGYAQI
jgi:hypothetical protein